MILAVSTYTHLADRKSQMFIKNLVSGLESAIVDNPTASTVFRSFVAREKNDFVSAVTIPTHENQYPLILFLILSMARMILAAKHNGHHHLLDILCSTTVQCMCDILQFPSFLSHVSEEKTKQFVSDLASPPDREYVIIPVLVDLLQWAIDDDLEQAERIIRSIAKTFPYLHKIKNAALMQDCDSVVILIGRFS